MTISSTLFKKNMFVFLKPKLISADAIIPLMMELKKARPEFQIHFLVPNDSWPDRSVENGKRTYNLLKRNFVLWKAMKGIGTIHVICTHNNKYKHQAVDRLLRFGDLLKLAMSILLSSKCYLFHFGVLNDFPYRYLAELNRFRGKTFSVEGSKCSGRSFHAVEEKLKGGHAHIAKHVGKFSISFSQQHYERFKAKRKYLLGPSHRFPEWMRMIDRISSDFYTSFYETHPQWLGKKILLYCLGIVDYQPGYDEGEMRHGRDGMHRLFLETIEVLNRFSDDLLIFLKPHYITNINYVAETVSNLENNNFILTYAHSEVILKRAVTQISNGFSTTLWDGKLLGVPTIEYSDYSEKHLAILKNGPFEPAAVDYFVNGDPKSLKECIRNIIENKRTIISTIESSFPPVDLSFIQKEIAINCRDMPDDTK